MSALNYAGIDVSEDSMVVFVTGQKETKSFQRTAKGIDELAHYLAGHKVVLAALEATGGLERPVVRGLMQRGIPTSVVNPRRIRNYAYGAGVMAKTDRLDAVVIELFARERKPQPRPLPTPQQELIRDLVARRRQLVKMRVAELNRQRRATDELVRESIKAILEAIDGQIEQMEAQIDQLIKASEEYQAKSKLLRSVKGVGQKTSRALLAEMPEIGQIGHKQIVSLAGLAPYDNQSGKLKGRSTIQGGRGTVRSALFMATLAAIRHNCDIKRFYKRLKAAGKPGKVAVAACMRKLLIVLNAVVARGTVWLPEKA